MSAPYTQVPIGFDMCLGCSNSNSIINISSVQFNSFQFQFNSNSIQFNGTGHQALPALRAIGGLVRLRLRTSGFILWPSWVPGVDSRARDCNDEIRNPCFDRGCKGSHPLAKSQSSGCCSAMGLSAFPSVNACCCLLCHGIVCQCCSCCCCCCCCC